MGDQVLDTLVLFLVIFEPCEHVGEKCSNLATYTVSLKDGSSGSQTGANVCAKHLFEGVAYYLGLPTVIT
jgi:hypothetical protein